MKLWLKLALTKSAPDYSPKSRVGAPWLRFTCVMFVVLSAAVIWRANAAPSDVAGTPAAESRMAGSDSESTGRSAGEEFDFDAQQRKLGAIMMGVDGPEDLARDLRDPDPVVAAAALQTLSSRNQRFAVQALLDVIHDTTEPVRLQALQLLLTFPDIDHATIMATLRTALRDSDPALVTRATEALVARDDPDADRALTDALRDGSVATRLSIVRFLGNHDSARQHIYYALRDPEEVVRSSAEAALSSLQTGVVTEP